ncbi:HAD-IA family hydrolase [Sulfitobacter albidus]|uniref:HAD-IA family hydrolase n=1 Tax=Sulfitobacter albidus TaxID=2829501 RepID=A0A975PLG8_9RHOB|nr:HAD-IA family hydrolase [Sulfitobacter albidus]QUJ75664.1 HAD-IA family hydrolase [Sulfitobacter albidus]
MSDAPLRLVIFDVDGTLVDSQADIIGAMTLAFAAEDLAMPDRATVLAQVGLSLHVMMPRLVPQADAATHGRLVEGYKAAYMQLRATRGAAESSPMYPGALQTLQRLHAQPEVLLGVATGKSRRGLDKLIEGHALEGLFVTQQVADTHPSKPHPAMLEAALSETGVEAVHAVMVGDTSYDMEMAASAGITGIAVSWGYHDRTQLGAATHLIEDFAALPPLLEDIWKE